MEKSSRSITLKIFGAFVIVGIVAIAIYVLVINNQPSSSSNETFSQQTPTEATSLENTTNIDAQATVKNYVDGTYVTKIDYDVPQGHTNTINVTLNLKSGLINSVEVKNTHTDEQSAFYDDVFQRDYKNNVVGKTLDTVPLRISGASLTNAAFQEALDTIATQAQ
jgi:hypothetical protein